MKIEFTESETGLVALDDTEGEFHIAEDGSISYIGADKSIWYVNSTNEKFERSVLYYQDYCLSISAESSEESQMEVVNVFKAKILATEDYKLLKHSYWQAIVFQAEHGHI